MKFPLNFMYSYTYAYSMTRREVIKSRRDRHPVITIASAWTIRRRNDKIAFASRTERLIFDTGSESERCLVSMGSSWRHWLSAQYTRNRYQEKTMLRFGVRGQSVCSENAEKCFDALGNIREASNWTISTSNTKHAAPKCRSRCLIDFETRLNERRRLSTIAQPRKTSLYDFHVENRGKMVNFSGWLLPVQYQEAIAASHQHTRTFASLFDVSHMMQMRVSGRDATDFLESLTTSDLKNLRNGCAVLSVFTNENGGILDDLIITKDDESTYFVVSNASRRTEDSDLLFKRQKEFRAHKKSVYLEFLDPEEQSLVALQGPNAASVLQSILKINLSYLKFMNSVETELLGNEIRITRCGYTGEDGFEISMPSDIAPQLVQIILATPDTKLAGLGARDSLRLEAGLCLYGHDIDESTTPVEAGLSWVVAKRRRAEANFPGAETILSQIKSGSSKKRVGLTILHGPPAREGACILTPEGERVGNITSGGPSPTLGRSIAMGYVPTELAQYGQGVLVEVRGKTYKATVTKMPFVKTNYYTAK